MALDKFVLELIEDPTDHQPLTYVASENVLYNPRLRLAYEVRDAIAVLLPTEARSVDEAEHARLVGDPSGVTTGR
jgi:uncharacterized protein